MVFFMFAFMLPIFPGDLMNYVAGMSGLSGFRFFIANLLAMILMFSAGIWMIYRWGVYGTIAGQALNALVVNIVLWSAWISLKRNLPSQKHL